MSKTQRDGLTPQGVRSLQRAMVRVLSRCRSREDLWLISKMLGGLSAIDEHCTVRNPGRHSAKVVYVLRGCDAGSQEASSVLYETPELASMDVTYAAAMACHEYITSRRRPINLLARGPLPPIAHVCQCLESLQHAMLLYSEADKTHKSEAARGLSQDQLHAMLLSHGLPEHWMSRLPPESYVNWWWLEAWYRVLLRISGSPGFCAIRYDHGAYKIDVGVREANWARVPGGGA